MGFVLLQVYNKVDQISIEEVDRLARGPNSVVIRSDFCDWQLSFPCVYMQPITSLFCLVCFSCGMKLNLDYLLEMLWEYLSLICIYTKKRGGSWIHLLLLLSVT